MKKDGKSKPLADGYSMCEILECDERDNCYVVAYMVYDPDGGCIGGPVSATEAANIAMQHYENNRPKP